MDTNALYEWVDELAERVLSLEDEIDSLHYALKTVQEENEGLKKNSSELVNVIARQTRDNHELVEANGKLREKIGTLNEQILSIKGNKAYHGGR